MSVVTFPLGKVLDIREQNFRQSEINRINAKIQANEQEIAKLAHANWVLRLERTKFEEI